MKEGLDSSECEVKILNANENAETFKLFLEGLELQESDIQTAQQGGEDDKDFSLTQQVKIELVEITVSDVSEDVQHSNETVSGKFH